MSFVYTHANEFNNLKSNDNEYQLRPVRSAGVVWTINSPALIQLLQLVSLAFSKVSPAVLTQDSMYHRNSLILPTSIVAVSNVDLFRSTQL